MIIINPDKVDILIFDFDGVITDNKVYLNQDGVESVCCNRSDGLAFDVLRALEKRLYIISTETNAVVSARATKLKIGVIQGVGDKRSVLKELLDRGKIMADRVLYVGNDLNDYHAMKMCGYKIAPANSHPKILDMADVVLSVNGGEGVVRELVEVVMGLDILEILYQYNGSE